MVRRALAPLVIAVLAASALSVAGCSSSPGDGSTGDGGPGATGDDGANRRERRGLDVDRGQRRLDRPGIRAPWGRRWRGRRSLRRRRPRRSRNRRRRRPRLVGGRLCPLLPHVGLGRQRLRLHGAGRSSEEVRSERGHDRIRAVQNGGCATPRRTSSKNMSDQKDFQAAGEASQGVVRWRRRHVRREPVQQARARWPPCHRGLRHRHRDHRSRKLRYRAGSGPHRRSENKMRGQALAMVQASKGIKVSFHARGKPVARRRADVAGSVGREQRLPFAAGVVISHVNFMTMDYGDSYWRFAPLPPPVVIGSTHRRTHAADEPRQHRIA